MKESFSQSKYDVTVSFSPNVFCSKFSSHTFFSPIFVLRGLLWHRNLCLAPLLFRNHGLKALIGGNS